MGLEVSVGAELEFYLLDPETGRPADVGNQVYGLGRAAELEHVLGPIRRQLPGVGIPIEQSNPEYAPGQVEVNVRYGPVLEAADRVIAFRAFVKEIAARHGYLATFMSKPFATEPAAAFIPTTPSGGTGVNTFAGPDGRLSPTGLGFLAGLQERMAETALAAATTPNAYRRRRPYTFCPVNNSWGVDNRTVGLRVIEGAPDAIRVEKRDGSADCNPYYLMACEVAAGLDGIERGLKPRHFTAGNGYELPEADPIPPISRPLSSPPASRSSCGASSARTVSRSRRPGRAGARLHGRAGHPGRDGPLPQELLMRLARITGRVSASIKSGKLTGFGCWSPTTWTPRARSSSGRS